MQFLEEDVEGGHDEEQGNSTDAHTANDADGQGTVTIGTGTSLDDEGNHSDNHRGYRHEDRTQTILTGLKGRLADVHALLAFVNGKLGDEDGSLGQQTNKHDDTRLQVDVVVHARQLEREAEVAEQERAHQSERDGQQHGEGDEPRVVERGKDEVDEQDGDAVDDRRGVRAHAFLHLTRHAAVFEGIVGRVEHLVEDLLHGLVGLTLGIALAGGDVGRDALEQVEAVLIVRTHGRGQRDELRERSHLTTAHTDEDVVERRGIETVLWRGVGQDAIHLTKLVVVAHVGLTTVTAHRGEHVLHGDAGARALRGIHVNLVLRELLGIGRLGIAHLRTLCQLFQECLHLVVKLGHVAVGLVFYHQLHHVVRTKTGNLRHRERQHLRLLDVLTVEVEAIHHQVEVVVHTLTVVPVFQTDEERAVAGACARYHTIAGATGVGFEFGYLLNLLLYLFEDSISLRKCASWGSTYFSDDDTLVFLWHQARGHHLHHPEHADDGDDEE